MAFFLSPICNDQQTDANGNPLVGGKVYTYLAGSSTPAATYTDSTGATPQANPIILNSLGLPASPIWLTGGVSYKFVIKTAADVTVRTVDNVTGVNDVSSTAQEWNETGFVPTYLSATQFSVPGDQTATLQVNRRLRNKVTSGYAYGRASVSTFSAGVTTVTMVNDGTPLDSGLSSVATSFLSASPTSIPYGAYQTVGDASQVLSKIQPILATVNGSGGAPANGVRVTLNPTWLDFRSTTANSGAVSTIQVPSALTLDVPSGATLGTISAVASKIAILAINNGGTVELAVVNTASVLLDESGTINTTAISGAASGLTTVYSAAARSSVAYMIVGYFISTQATAGTWVTVPTLVQGVRGYTPITQAATLGTAVTTSGANSYDITGIASYAKRITVTFNQVSDTTPSNMLIQLGSGSVQTTGYAATGIFAGTSASGATSTAGFPVVVSQNGTSLISGQVVFTHMGGNTWSCFGVLARTNENLMQFCAGVVTLSGALDRLRLTTASGTSAFDGGSINTLVE
jgi:hypothetical protein